MPHVNQPAVLCHQPIIIPRQNSAPGSTREGFGGEKTDTKAVSLHEPTIPRISNQSRNPTHRCFRPAPASCRTQGGAGGGGHDPRHPQPDNGQNAFHTDRIAGSDCDHRDSGKHVAAGLEPGAGAGTIDLVPERFETIDGGQHHVHGRQRGLCESTCRKKFDNLLVRSEQCGWNGGAAADATTTRPDRCFPTTAARRGRSSVRRSRRRRDFRPGI